MFFLLSLIPFALPPGSVGDLGFEVSPPTELVSPRLDPKHRLEYRWVVRVNGSGVAGHPLRFRVYIPTSKHASIAQSTARFLGNLWSLTKSRLGFDHPLATRSLVDVFLAEGGKPGGEQSIFSGPDEDGQVRSHNTIYIYEFESLDRPIQMLRELSHEYGHAVLPAVGGFETPEEWGNGFLGERLLLLWVMEAFQTGEFSSEDVCGVDLRELVSWVSERVYPLSDAVWERGPDRKALMGKGLEAMNAYIGIILQVAEGFPLCLPRSMRLSGGQKAMDALKGLELAVQERNEWDIQIPIRLRGKAVWLPMGNGWKFEGANVQAQDANGSRILPSSSVVTARRKVS